MSSLTLDREVLNHLQNDPIPFVVEGYREKALHLSTTAFPLIGALVPEVGIPLRGITDLSQLFTTGKGLSWETGQQLIKSVFSGVAAYTIFFAPKYFKQIEIGRSLVMHTRDVYQAIGEALKSGKKEKVIQACLHLVTDITNLLIARKSSLELQCTSHLLQLAAGAFDFKEQWDSDSKIGMGVQAGLTGLRLMSLVATGKELYKSTPPKTISINPCSAEIPQAAPLYIQGTGSEELGKLKVVSYLGKEELSGDLFLVEEKDGTLRTLKRFFRESEKAESSAAYAFGYLFTAPFRILGAFCGLDFDYLEVEKIVDISKAGAPNVLEVIKTIRNTYEKEVVEKDGKKVMRSFKDVYLLMERFVGTPIKQHPSPDLNLMQRVTKTLSSIAETTNYFYNSASRRSILVAGENLKFTSFEVFTKGSSWNSCMDIYKKLHSFFAKLINLLPEKERLTEELQKIFCHLDLIKSYKAANEDLEVKKTCEATFNSTLLKSILAKIEALFSQ